MRRFALYFLFFLSLFSVAQASSQPIRISKLVIDFRKSHSLSTRDSMSTYIIDTLVMNDKSRLFFVNKKRVDLIVHHAIIGKDCEIGGSDGKNNGTDLNLAVNFVQLESVYVDVSGREAKNSNRHFDNGNGGKVVVHYLASGIKPQTSSKKAAGYLAVSNKAGGNLVNPQTEVRIIMDQVRRGTPGRVGNFPQGRVYSGGTGKDGSTSIESVVSLQN